jgi:hypothetical protein
LLQEGSLETYREGPRVSGYQVARLPVPGRLQIPAIEYAEYDRQPDIFSSTHNLAVPPFGLPEGTLASILAELVSLDGRLDLALDRLADAQDPAPCGRGG